ncbi:PREDICTED: uncharacterized protein LOC109193302 [Ipomoea nil]|uniref:uncharacterized protein LOC109193302 n=1 Tax=Ipomoea nil TaxID=35883 RepID=UPI00090091DB|nr:PREDICTED: uncharacterized protein LOC109193302 [Ipomoea nil]
MNDILKRVEMVECKALVTLVSLSRVTNDGANVPYVDPTRYHSLAGALQYLTVTRHDLSFAVIKFCTLHFGLHVCKSSSVDIHAFSDSDWVGDPSDRRSTSGFAVFSGRNLVSWTCRKQRMVARCSTEAEYKALADVSAEVTWLVSLLTGLGLRPSSPPTLWCDNLGATYLCANPEVSCPHQACGD